MAVSSRSCAHAAVPTGEARHPEPAARSRVEGARGPQRRQPRQHLVCADVAQPPCPAPPSTLESTVPTPCRRRYYRHSLAIIIVIVAASPISAALCAGARLTDLQVHPRGRRAYQRGGSYLCRADLGSMHSSIADRSRRSAHLPGAPLVLWRQCKRVRETDPPTHPGASRVYMMSALWTDRHRADAHSCSKCSAPCPCTIRGSATARACRTWRPCCSCTSRLPRPSGC